MAADFFFGSYDIVVFVVPESKDGQKLPQYSRDAPVRQNHDGKGGVLEGYPEQSDFRQRRVCPWFYPVVANGDSDGMVPPGQEYY